MQELSKECSKCNLSKNLSEFRKHSTGKYNVSSVCKLCEKLYYHNTPKSKLQRSLYAKTDKFKEACKKYSLKRRRERKPKMIEALGGKCNHCGISFPECVYEFHHTDPTKKDFGISEIMGVTWERLEKELKKCILLCANCHRIEHYGGIYGKNSS